MPEGYSTPQRRLTRGEHAPAATETVSRQSHVKTRVFTRSTHFTWAASGHWTVTDMTDLSVCLDPFRAGRANLLSVQEGRFPYKGQLQACLPAGHGVQVSVSYMRAHHNLQVVTLIWDRLGMRRISHHVWAYRLLPSRTRSLPSFAPPSGSVYAFLPGVFPPPSGSSSPRM